MAPQVGHKTIKTIQNYVRDAFFDLEMVRNRLKYFLLRSEAFRASIRAARGEEPDDPGAAAYARGQLEAMEESEGTKVHFHFSSSFKTRYHFSITLFSTFQS